MVSYSDIRFLGFIGVWSLHNHRGVVPAEAARIMVRGAYYYIGAGPCWNKWGKVEGENREVPVAVVAIVNSGRSRMEAVMHLMRALFFTAKYDIVITFQGWTTGQQMRHLGMM